MDKIPAKTSTKTEIEAENRLETLQSFSFEIIQKTMQFYRNFKDTGHGKARKLAVGFKLHQMIVDAIKVHPDVRDILKMKEVVEELMAEYELAKKRWPIIGERIA